MSWINSLDIADTNIYIEEFKDNTFDSKTSKSKQDLLYQLIMMVFDRKPTAPVVQTTSTRIERSYALNIFKK